MKKLVLIAVVAAVWRPSLCGDRKRPPPLRLVSFNIENYPRDMVQVQHVFEAIAALEAHAVGVQEITNPPSFAAEAKRQLGDRWRFVYPSISPRQRVGVLYDDAVFALLSTRTHTDTIIYRDGKPAFEVRLRPRRGGAVVRMIVVHLKAGGTSETIRGRQLAALGEILVDAVHSGERVVLLGDFNATGAADRESIAALTARLDMTWATEALECTAYWRPGGGNCEGAALDHAITAAPPRSVRIRGGCADSGCSPDRCPLWYERVSDHCPVQIDLR